MPTPIVPAEKTAFIAIVNVVDPIEATRLATILVNYDDVVTAIRRQLDEFAANPAYLFEAMDVFLASNSDLIAAGIYNNGSSASVLSNPKLFINFTTTDTTLSTIADGWINILGNSVIEKITVSTATNLEYLYIGPGCTLDVLDSSATNAYVNNLYLPFIKNRPATLNALQYGSGLGNLQVSPGSYYGGVKNFDPLISCAIPVTSLAIGIITHNTIELTWVPPASGYLFVNVYYKRTDSGTWILAGNDAGDYVLNTGFMFRYLAADVSYDFKVTVVCNNGGTASAYISAQTPCCGDTNFSTCPVIALIVASPNPNNTQTLCNGVVALKEYAAGTTLTVLKQSGAPLLAGLRAPVDVTTDDVPYQQFPFDSTTGTLDASGTPLGVFIVGNVVTFYGVLPS